MVWKPNVTVAAVVRHDDRYLTVRERVEGRILLNQPAGHLEEGETLIEAVKREVLEETAWTFEPRFLIGVYLYRQPDVTYLRFCFGGDCKEFHAGRALDEDIIEASWMTRDELQDNADSLRSPLVLHCVDDFLAGRAHPIEILSHWPAPGGGRQS